MGSVLVRSGKGLVLYTEHEENSYLEKMKRDCQKIVDSLEMKENVLIIFWLLKMTTPTLWRRESELQLEKNYHKLRYSYLILHYLISEFQQNKVEEHQIWWP